MYNLFFTKDKIERHDGIIGTWIDDIDSLDIQGSEDAKGGTANVIGGSGKWKGATGTGNFELVSHNNDLSTFTYKLTITVP